MVLRLNRQPSDGSQRLGSNQLPAIKQPPVTCKNSTIINKPKKKPKDFMQESIPPRPAADAEIRRSVIEQPRLPKLEYFHARKHSQLS